MPIKYNNYKEKDDYIGNTPIVEQIIPSTSNNDKAVNDMMSNIISEKQKMDNTAVIKMTGALTPVLYYHNVLTNTTGGTLVSNSSGPSNISIENKKFQKIKNFLIKIESGIQLESPEEEEDKAYSASGTIIIMPRTIQPSEGDYFIMEYYNKKYCWFITGVEVATFENDNGFRCTFSLYKKDYVIPESQVTATYIYHHEFVGTTYRPILTPEEYEILQHAGALYNHISDIYNSLFYDKIVNGYVFKDYDYEKSKKHYKDINNINTLGRRGGNFRGSYDGEVYSVINQPVKVKEEAKAYDNLINKFMYDNKIFRNFEGVLLSVEPMLTVDRVCYKRSIYGCLEANTVAYFKNTLVSPTNIQMLQQGLCSYLVGKKNVLYHSKDDESGETYYTNNSFNNISEFFPQTLTDQLLNGNKLDMSVKCTGKVYSSIDNFIIETIVRYVYKKTDDFVDRIKYLYNNMDVLYEHEIAYNKIFYLFPLLGFVLEQSLQKIYSDNIDQNNVL